MTNEDLTTGIILFRIVVWCLGFFGVVMLVQGIALMVHGYRIEKRIDKRIDKLPAIAQILVRQYSGAEREAELILQEVKAAHGEWVRTISK